MVGTKLAEYDVPIAVIGGTGVYNMEGLENVEDIHVDTPFGTPSDKIRVGTLCGVRVAFLARHGRGHQYLPQEVPYKANIYALKRIGVRFILAVSACGSLTEKASPRDMIIPDQVLDRTKARDSTFFGKGIVAHIGFDKPTCPVVNNVLMSAFDNVREKLDGPPSLLREGTYVIMEGPAFSTKAESNMYRMLGGTCIGMTVLPEVKLAREAEISYGVLACVTDFDCWHPEHDSVTVESVVKNLHVNANNATVILKEAIRILVDDMKLPSTDAHTSLASAILTPFDKVPQATMDSLFAILEKYAPKSTYE